MVYHKIITKFITTAQVITHITHPYRVCVCDNVLITVREK